MMLSSPQDEQHPPELSQELRVSPPCPNCGDPDKNKRAQDYEQNGDLFEITDVLWECPNCGIYFWHSKRNLRVKTTRVIFDESSILPGEE